MHMHMYMCMHMCMTSRLVHLHHFVTPPLINGQACTPSAGSHGVPGRAPGGDAGTSGYAGVEGATTLAQNEPSGHGTTSTGTGGDGAAAVTLLAGGGGDAAGGGEGRLCSPSTFQQHQRCHRH